VEDVDDILPQFHAVGDGLTLGCIRGRCVRGGNEVGNKKQKNKRKVFHGPYKIVAKEMHPDNGFF
jgi:uncharacterized protein YjcR